MASVVSASLDNPWSRQLLLLLLLRFRVFSLLCHSTITKCPQLFDSIVPGGEDIWPARSTEWSHICRALLGRGDYSVGGSNGVPNGSETSDHSFGDDRSIVWTKTAWYRYTAFYRVTSWWRHWSVTWQFIGSEINIQRESTIRDV